MLFRPSNVYNRCIDGERAGRVFHFFYCHFSSKTFVSPIGHILETMLPEAENVVDSLPYYYYLVALLPLMLVMGGAPGAMCTTVTNQYLVYRIHQLDTPQGSFGSKSSIFNLEAITPTQINDFFIRKCALFKMADLVQSKSELFLNKVLQESLVSGVLIIFDDESMSFHSEEMASLQAIERRLLSNATDLPIYLIKANDEINQLYEEYGKSKAAVVKASIYDVVVNNIFTDSHQLVVTSPQTSAINGATVTSFQVRFHSLALCSKICLLFPGQTDWGRNRGSNSNLRNRCPL